MADPKSVPCNYCSAAVGEPCVNLKTKKPLERFAAHPGRERLANPVPEHEEWWQK